MTFRRSSTALADESLLHCAWRGSGKLSRTSSIQQHSGYESCNSTEEVAMLPFRGGLSQIPAGIQFTDELIRSALYVLLAL